MVYVDAVVAVNDTDVNAYVDSVDINTDVDRYQLEM